MGQLKSVIKQIENNQKAFKVRINNIGIVKLKILAVKRFNRTRLKLKGFLIQIRLKLYNKGYKVPIQAKAVAYTGLFLTGKALKWFKPYITEYQNNGINTINKEVWYMFLQWNIFAAKLIQIYKDLKAKAIAKQKI